MDGSAGLVYQLAIASCDTAACPIGIALVRDTRPLDWTELIKGRCPQPSYATDDGYAWDDPLASDEVSYWEIGFSSTGEPPYGAAIRLRALPLAPALTALLANVAMQTHHGIMHLELKDMRYAASVYGSETYDTWYASAVRWNAGEAVMEDVPYSQRPPLYAAIVGSFPTVEEARARFDELHAGDAGHRCLVRFWVVRSNWFPRLNPDWAIIAALSGSRDGAVDVLAAAQRCNTALDGYVRRAQ